MAEDPLKQTAARVFLAIPLHEIFHLEIDRILEPLRRKVPGVSWGRTEQIHLTLHFFGSLPAADIDRIDASMKKIAACFSSLELTLKGIGGFPSLKRPDTLWLEVGNKEDRLLSLQKAIQKEVRTLGFKVESCSFRPHATIGRVQKRSGDRIPFLGGVPFKFPTDRKMADHFVLYQSRCLPEGARYEILKTYSLSKKT